MAQAKVVSGLGDSNNTGVYSSFCSQSYQRYGFGGQIICAGQHFSGMPIYPLLFNAFIKVLLIKEPTGAIIHNFY
jgi:hypothetical protein